jgi:hypothetical protein
MKEFGSDQTEMDQMEIIGCLREDKLFTEIMFSNYLNEMSSPLNHCLNETCDSLILDRYEQTSFSSSKEINSNLNLISLSLRCPDLFHFMIRFPIAQLISLQTQITYPHIIALTKTRYMTPQF